MPNTSCQSLFNSFLLFILLSFFLPIFPSYSQPSTTYTTPIPPPIYSFTSRDYNAHPQIFCAVPLKDGRFALGTAQEVLVFDGNDYIYVPIGAGKYVLSMDYRRDTLWVGTLRDFGFITHDSSGMLAFHSLLHLIPDSLRDFNIIWRTHALHGAVVFNGYSHLYLYIPTRDTIIVLNPPQGKKVFSIPINSPTPFCL